MFVTESIIVTLIICITFILHTAILSFMSLKYDSVFEENRRLKSDSVFEENRHFKPECYCEKCKDHGRQQGKTS